MYLVSSSELRPLFKKCSLILKADDVKCFASHLTVELANHVKMMSRFSYK